MTGMTEIQAHVLTLFLLQHSLGYPPPTHREISAHFGWGSTNASRQHLRALARKGFIQLGESRKQRSTRLLPPAFQYLLETECAV